MGAPAGTPAANPFLFAWGWREKKVCGGQIEVDLRDPVPLVYPGMMQAPSYQPAMIPAPMPMMPAMGTVPTMPGEAGLREPGEKLPGLRVCGRVLLGVQMVSRTKRFKSAHGAHPLRASAVLPCTAMMVPPQPQPLMSSLDTRQLAVQQQNFINQQAMILVRTEARQWGCLEGVGMGVGPAQALTGLASPFPKAQQMTTQAMSLSLEQQNQRRQRQPQASGAASQPPPSTIVPKVKKPPAPQEKPESNLEPLDVYSRVRNLG